MVWGPWRRRATVLSPAFSLLVLQIAIGGRDSFTVKLGSLPLSAFLAIVGV